MAETTFGITYDGPALESGRMPVRDLAPALLALSDLFTLAGGVLYPALEPVAVKVEATKEGSFAVHLLIDAGDAWDQMVDLFTSDEVSALVNLRDAVLLSGAGLFWLIRLIAKRRVARVDQAPDPGHVRLTLDDQTTLELPTETWTLYRNVEIRKYTREVVEPLARQGVEVVTFSTERSEPVVVEEDDLEAFAVIEGEEEPLLETEQEMFLEIVAVAFIRGNKWRLGIGDSNFWASIEDEAFLDRVESGEEAFRKGDILRCLVEITQTRDAAGLHTEHRVLEVRGHLPRSRQLTIGDSP